MSAKKYQEALTPSPETKAAYMGKFTMPLPDIDEDGNEVMRHINVPWTTIKKIMRFFFVKMPVLAFYRENIY